MRVTSSSDGMTIRAIAGTYNVLLGIDLDEKHREGCLGFTISRTVKSTGVTKPLPNAITFPDADEKEPITTENAPLQKFRWGDYTAVPGETYTYKVTARYGKPGALTDGPTASVSVTTEDPKSHATPIFFNRGAAASQAYNREFGQQDPDDLPPDQRVKALAWLSRGLEEAILDFLAQAKDANWGLHAAIYEFQKPNLLAGLKAAIDRGAEVDVVYHYRHKGDADKTWTKNEAAAKAAGIDDHCTRRTADPGVIMHNKFVVLLKNGEPQAVWTGSTNWTDGGIYGQLNVGHAVYDPKTAKIYEEYFQLLKQDLPAAKMKPAVAALLAVPSDIPGAGVLPILSPQPKTDMLDLYGKIAKGARVLLVSAPFELAGQITSTFDPVPEGVLHYLLLDKEGSLGDKKEIDVIEHSKGNSIGFAATLDSPLTSFQERLLKDAAPEHYHHPGIHIHSKIIISDPFGDDPILVTGSANFSNNSTVHNDSNSLLVRGDKGVTDIYATEFMRMFEHYHFRAAVKKAAGSGKPEKKTITLAPDDSWTNPFYVEGSNEALDRMLFAGTLPGEGSGATGAAAAAGGAAALAAAVVTKVVTAVASKVVAKVKAAVNARSGKRGATARAVEIGGAAASEKAAASTKKAASTTKKAPSATKKAGSAKEKAPAATTKAAAATKKAAAAKKKAAAAKKQVPAATKKAAAATKKAPAAKKQAPAAKKQAPAAKKQAPAAKKKAPAAAKKAPSAAKKAPSAAKKAASAAKKAASAAKKAASSKKSASTKKVASTKKSASTKKQASTKKAASAKKAPTRKKAASSRKVPSTKKRATKASAKKRR